MSRLTLQGAIAYSAPHFLGRSFQNFIGRWRNATVSVVMALGLLLGAQEARADGKPVCNGVSLPAGSKKLEGDAKDCRFRSSLNWDETVKFFERELPSSSTRWHREVNIPAAKYRHVESTAQKGVWEGLNIYQVGGDPSAEVRMYVIPKPVEVKKASKEDASKKKNKKDSKKKVK